MLQRLPNRSRSRTAPLFAFVALALLLLGCASEVESQEPATVGEGGEPEVLAVIDGESVTLDDLRDTVGAQLDQLEYQYRSQRHQLLEQGLESVLRDRLLEAEAAEREVSVDALLAEEIGEVEISADQVVTFYESNQARLQGRTLAELRPAIRQFLADQEREARIATLTERIAEDRSVERRLDPFRVELESDGHPASGPEDAPVTLVEFSDFECPYCGGFFETLERIEQEYGDRIRVVYRQFPLREIHPNAQVAAEASLCAWDQGMFWELHDLMFQEQDSLTTADLQGKAERLGLDMEAFNGCLESGKYVERVQADIDAGARLNVTGTPALFVNGRPVEGGAVPYETIVEILEDELDRVGG